MKRGLIALAVGTFALGIAEFGMMGFLEEVAKGVGVDIPKAGHLISSYSLGVALGAPMLIVLRRMPLHRLMALLTAVIFVGNLGAALSPGYSTLLLARFVSGLPHGAFFGAGAIVCARLADKGHGATAVAVMVGGMTVANVIGVPMATLLSNLLGWRWAFGVIALVALVAYVMVKFELPELAPMPDTGIKGQFAFLRRLAPWLIYGGVFFGQGAVYCWLSYIQPIMTQLTHFATGDMTWIMMLAGVGMVVGNIAAGRLADRFGTPLVTASITVLMLIVMPAIYLCAGVKWASLPLEFTACACLFGIGGPLQYLITRYSRGGEMLGGAGIQIAFNVSNAVAASLGGAVISHGYSVATPALLGAPMAAIAGVFLWMLWSKTYNGKTVQ